MPQLLADLWRWALGRRSVGRYGVIGASGVLLDFLIFSVLVAVGLYPPLASGMGTLAGISNNYFWNSRLNFHVGLSKVRGLKFLVVGTVGLAISALLVFVLMELGFSPHIAKAISVFPVVIGQFLGNKFWTFRINN